MCWRISTAWHVPPAPRRWQRRWLPACKPVLTPLLPLPARAAAQPRVLHLEWVEPLMCGGHWIPEMVELAGGSNCFGRKDTGSFRLEWSEVIASQPEVIIVMPCGFNVERACQDVPVLAKQEGWATLPAVQQGRIYVIDAGAYTSRSGPRLVQGLEILAEMIHPELFSGLISEGAGVRLGKSL